MTIVAAGKKRNVTTTAQTVAGALTAAKIKVDGNDKLSVKPTAKLVDGTSVRYIRVTESNVTRKVALAYKTVRKETSKLDKGDTKVDAKGVKGVRTLTYKVVRHDGKTVSKKRTSDKVTRKPVTRVLLVGTKEEKPKDELRRRLDPVGIGGLGQRVGPAGPVRVGRQLVDQHRQRLLRRAAVLGEHLARVRRVGAAAPEQPGPADRHRPEAAGGGRLGPVAGV